MGNSTGPDTDSTIVTGEVVGCEACPTLSFPDGSTLVS